MTSYQEEVDESILFQLSNEVLGSQLLSDKTGIPYATVRKALVRLEESGKIIKFDRRARGARYSLAPDDGTYKPTNIIPSIMFKGKSIPLTQIYRNQGIEEVTSNAVNDFLRAWTTIAITARRLSEGVPTDALIKRVNRERVSLIQARANLEQILFIMNQVLDNEKLWDPIYLSNFHEDADWLEFLPHLEELYSHYFSSETNG